MKKGSSISVCGAVLLTVLASISEADDLEGRTGLGLGNPYICIKQGLSTRLSVEARVALGSGIGVYGGRLYYNVNPKDTTVLFVGGEGDYVRFDTDDISGKGYVVYLFAGGEHFLTRRLTVSLDIGPAFIGLEGEASRVSVDGVEYVVNVGVNFYFRGRGGGHVER